MKMISVLVPVMLCGSFAILLGCRSVETPVAGSSLTSGSVTVTGIQGQELFRALTAAHGDVKVFGPDARQVSAGMTSCESSAEGDSYQCTVNTRAVLTSGHPFIAHGSIAKDLFTAYVQTGLVKVEATETGGQSFQVAGTTCTVTVFRGFVYDCNVITN
ncbi:MAG: hypothetical protein NTV34_18810 [Proteobacteria bacterium]|nr:hypothetical protein [Pseudomonadota bacterium]